MSGPTAVELSRFGRRYPAVGRAVVSIVCAATAPFADPPAGVGLAVAAAVVIVVWHLVLLALMLPERPGCRWFGRVFAVDIVAKCLLCLAQPLLVAPHLLATSRRSAPPMRPPSIGRGTVTTFAAG